MRYLVRPARRYEEQLEVASDIVRQWKGTLVKVGIALSNPVWCSDGLLHDAVGLARDLGSPIEIHAEESPVQRKVSLSQWGMSGVQRLAKLGVLSERTLAAHCVQVDDADIALLAQHGCSVSHNPISNLKLQNGIAPAGKMLAAGINVCLGTDGQACSDSQSLFPVLKFVVALAGLNGIRDLGGRAEEIAVRMASEHGRRLWFDADLSGDYMRFRDPLGTFGVVWDEPAQFIDEVYVAGQPRLAKARQVVEESGAFDVTRRLIAQSVTPEMAAAGDRFAAVTARFADG
jgi:hypothetical protein